MRRVVEPLLNGTDLSRIQNDDLQYVRDLGLVSRSGPVEIANPIYREVIPREISNAAQVSVADRWEMDVAADGRLRIEVLLASFQQYCRENSEHWVDRFGYREAGPQLLLQAFLQRIVNGGGRIERKYGLGRLRTDLSSSGQWLEMSQSRKKSRESSSNASC